jgi:hypothetical protein
MSNEDKVRTPFGHDRVKKNLMMTLGEEGVTLLSSIGFVTH